MRYFLFILCIVLRVQFGYGNRQPNVILIMTDDQGYGDISYHGSPVLKTPNLDALAKTSVRFTDFHVAPMCTPTRGQLMTGMDAMRNGATAVCQGRSMVREEIKMMPEYFKENGYATGLFGKWHLGDSYPHRPEYRGFEEVLSFGAWGITSLADYWGNDYFDPVLLKNGNYKKYKGYCTDIFFNEAMNFMEQCKDKDKPFFIYLPTNTPHVPEIVPEEFSKPYQKEYMGKQLPADFYGMIANIDENIGKLENFLDNNGLKDNTILIFLSDNGTQNSKAQAIYNAGMRAKKASVYEGGHRVPLFIRWIDGQLQLNVNINDLTQVQDLLPTLIDLCGLEVSEVDFDGVSLKGLLDGTKKNLEDRMCVSQFNISGKKWGDAVVMWNKWRLIKENELYNIEQDPSQERNVYKSHTDVAKKMIEFYETWYSEAEKQFNKKRYIYVGSKSVTLYSNDWQGGYCDNLKGLIKANTNGYWDLNITEKGNYFIELRRWPEESQKAITESFDGITDNGAIPAKKVNLLVASFNKNKPVKTNDKVIVFKVPLKQGRTTLQTAFLDEDNVEICGAMFVKITKE